MLICSCCGDKSKKSPTDNPVGQINQISNCMNKFDMKNRSLELGKLQLFFDLSKTCQASDAEIKEFLNGKE